MICLISVPIYLIDLLFSIKFLALNRYPSVFDSATPPASPGVVSRGLDQEKGPVDYPAGKGSQITVFL